MDNKVIGHKLKSLRLQKGLNQSQLGQHLNVSRTAIGNWERGDRSISMTDLTLITQYFGVSITYFTGEEVVSAHEEVVDNNNVIKIYSIKPRPNLVQIVISLYLILISVMGVYFQVGNPETMTLVFYLFWFFVLIMMIAYQLYETKKHEKYISFSSLKRPYFCIKDDSKINIDYMGHIFYSVLVLVTMVMLVVVSRNYYQDYLLANYVVIVSIVLFGFSSFASLTVMAKKPKEKFPYYPTNRYFSLLLLDIMFYLSAAFAVFMIGAMSYYGVKDIPLLISLVTILILLGMVMVSYVLRFEHRVLFDRYKIVIE